MTDRILRRREVESCIGLSRSTIYEAIATGEFPKPIKLGKRAVGWRESVVLAWLERRALATEANGNPNGKGPQL